MKKQFGGLGIPNLQDINMCPLGSWVKRYSRDGTLSKLIIDHKYRNTPNIFSSISNPQLL